MAAPHSVRRTFLPACALALTIASSGAARADTPIEGRWSGAVVRLNAVQTIDVTLEDTGHGLAGSYAIPDLFLYDEPLREVARDDSTVTFRILYGPFTMRLHDGVDEMTGGNARWNPPLALHLKRVVVPPTPWLVTHDVTFDAGDATLAATLYEPAAGGPFPAAVVVPGSGEQSRADWSLRAHAYALVRSGIACLVYDKRGVGGSTGDYEGATFHELARDATAAVGVLRERDDIRADAVGLMGISQGGWISAIAAHEEPAPDFVVFLEGPARSLFDQELDRVRYSMTADGVAASAVDSACAHTRLYLEVAGGERAKWPALARSTEAARAAQWADYVSLPDSVDDGSLRWWRRCAYDPARDLSRITVPVLVVLGAEDPVVPVAENRPLFERYLGAAGVSFRIVVVPDLYHAAATYHSLVGGAWDWPRAFWAWSRRPPALDAVLGPWIRTAAGLP